jgi:hypothetical protein
MHRAYRFAIVYFVLFGLMLLLSAGALFLSKIGFSAEAVSLYYLGSDTVAGKSPYGLLETAVPHLGAMGLYIMVTAHFLLFAPAGAKRRAVAPAVALFLAAALDIVSGAFVAAGYQTWIWIKLAAFAALMTLCLYLSLLILYYAFWHSLSPQRHPR